MLLTVSADVLDFWLCCRGFYIKAKVKGINALRSASLVDDARPRHAMGLGCERIICINNRFI